MRGVSMTPCSAIVPSSGQPREICPASTWRSTPSEAHLRDLTAAQEVLGGSQEPFESFTARLERKLDSPAVLLREAGGVLLAPMHTLHSLRFDYVALGGLIEGEFPAQRTGDDLARQRRKGGAQQGGPRNSRRSRASRRTNSGPP